MDTMNKLAKKMISGLLCLCYALGADGRTDSGTKPGRLKARRQTIRGDGPRHLRTQARKQP